ncbi:MAG: hypothetical protein L0332_11790 [Chloroflexi bacterium]|nr:hypothetical protein [Chloroflexota bacterium]MCI0580078.1 hypothetical protein [Chloroflexota bacterium]MCI0648428.1 hypothetical protein [Chloroflexota bacterium]MCI0727391.1 hypothetical protein [Chloroflexota bacterium]
MSKQSLLGMSDAEFEALIERYIERQSAGPAELDADLFFDSLADFVAAPAETTIELVGEWHEGQLTLKPEEPPPPDVVVQDNRIVSPGFTFVIRVKEPAAGH